MTASGLFRRHSLFSGVAFAVLIGSSGPNAVAAICGDGTIEDESPCACDCNGDSMATVDEILTAVNIALGNSPVGTCPEADPDGSGAPTVDEIITCVNFALNGCPAGGAGQSAAEECDDGGLCVGGANAGTVCDSESDCIGDGACFGGSNNLRACDSDDDCAGAPCRRCRPYGGDGCAANCTFESDDPCNLVAGVIDEGIGIQPGTSGATIFTPVIPVVPLPLLGTQVATIGKVVDGTASLVIKTTGVNLDRINVSNVACACVRGIEARACGGVLFDKDGLQTGNCTPGFAEVDTCPVDMPCAAVHGPGNSASGFIRCGDPGFDILITQDCNGATGGMPSEPEVTITASTFPVSVGEGSGVVAVSSAIGTVVGQCTGTTSDYGPDGQFCTDDDPVSTRGMPGTAPFTTSRASAVVFNAGNLAGNELGPEETSGAPFTCNTDESISVSGTNLGGAFTLCDQPTLTDMVVTTNFVCE